MNPIIFLDIDGVLNAHDYDDAAKSCTIRPECVRAFNRILAATDAKIVLSSAWRYMICEEAMTLKGFGYLLRTHGVHCDGRLVGLTYRDEIIEGRGNQIEDWLRRHEAWDRLGRGPCPEDFYVTGEDPVYLVLDDGGTDPDTGDWHDMGIPAAGHPVLWTDGKVGLTEADADRAIAMLDGSESAPRSAPPLPRRNITDPAD